MQRNTPASVGLDIGSDKIVCVVGVHDINSPVPTIVGVGTAQNSGVRKGAVVDVEDTTQAINAAIKEAERVSGFAIERATIGVGGSHIKSVNSNGVIAVGGIQNSITSEDVARVEEAAAVIQLPPNREIVQVFSRQYRLDGQENIKDPVGMSGVRLEVDAHIVTAATPALKNLQRSVYQAGLVANNQIMVALASAQAVLDHKQREHGAVVIDIGHSTTSIAVFEEGEILHTAVLNIGSNHITNDLAIGLKTDLTTAEKIKRSHVNIRDGKAKKTELTLKDNQKNTLSIKQSDINSIAIARLEEIFEHVNKELAKVKRERNLPGGAVVTGGGALLDGIELVAKNTLQLPAIVGVPDGFSGLVDIAKNPMYSAGIGLMMEDMFFGSHVSDSKIGSLISGVISSFTKVVHKLKP